MSLEKKSETKRGGKAAAAAAARSGSSGGVGVENGGGTGHPCARRASGCARSTTSGCGTHAHWPIGAFCVLKKMFCIKVCYGSIFI